MKVLSADAALSRLPASLCQRPSWTSPSYVRFAHITRQRIVARVVMGSTRSWAVAIDRQRTTVEHTEALRTTIQPDHEMVCVLRKGKNRNTPLLVKSERSRPRCFHSHPCNDHHES